MLGEQIPGHAEYVKVAFRVSPGGIAGLSSRSAFDCDALNRLTAKTLAGSGQPFAEYGYTMRTGRGS